MSTVKDDLQDDNDVDKDLEMTTPEYRTGATEDVAEEKRFDAVDVEKDTQAQADADTTPPPPPDGGYGWVCTVCCALINGHTWGLNSSYGVFLAYYLRSNTFPGATSLDFAFIGGLSISIAMFIAPVATLFVRYFGTKPTLLVGVVLETASLIGASFAHKIWQLFLSQGVCFGLGMGFLFVASVGIPAQWFTNRRSLANGISACGSGIGGLVYSLAVGAMLKSIGLAWAFRVLGILCFAVNTICTLLLRDRNKIIGSSTKAFEFSLYFRAEYLLLCGYGFFSMLGYVVLIFSLSNYANSIGLGASQAATVSALLNLGQGLGRPPIGYFSDNVGRMNMAGAMTLLCAIFSFAIWIPAKSYGVLIFFAIIVGMVAGTFWATIAPLSAEVCGLKHVPSALNLMWITIVLPTLFSEPIALEIIAGTGKYIGTQLFVGFMYIAAALCMLFLRGWKIGQLEEMAQLRGETVQELNAHVAENDADVAEKARVAGRRRIVTDFWQIYKV